MSAHEKSKYASMISSGAQPIPVVPLTAVGDSRAIARQNAEALRGSRQRSGYTSKARAQDFLMERMRLQGDKKSKKEQEMDEIKDQLGQWEEALAKAQAMMADAQAALDSFFSKRGRKNPEEQRQLKRAVKESSALIASTEQKRQKCTKQMLEMQVELARETGGSAAAAFALAASSHQRMKNHSAHNNNTTATTSTSNDNCSSGSAHQTNKKTNNHDSNTADIVVPPIAYSVAKGAERETVKTLDRAWAIFDAA